MRNPFSVGVTLHRGTASLFLFWVIMGIFLISVIGIFKEFHHFRKHSTSLAPHQ